MWWSIPLVVLIIFIFVGIPLILEYRTEIKEKYNKKIIFIKKGEKIMKNGNYIYAKTHAEFLNEAFGTNYKAWMKCVWKYDDEWAVWMVRFNKTDGGYTNTFLTDSRIKEEDILCQDRPVKDKKKIVIEIDDSGSSRKYIFRGKFVYDEKNSDPYNCRYYDKVSDEL